MNEKQGATSRAVRYVTITVPAQETPKQIMLDRVQRHMPTASDLVLAIRQAFDSQGSPPAQVHERLCIDPERIVADMLKALQLDPDDFQAHNHVLSLEAEAAAAKEALKQLGKSLGGPTSCEDAAPMTERLRNAVAEVDWRLRRLALLEERLGLTPEIGADSNYDAYTFCANLEALARHFWPDLPTGQVFAALQQDGQALQRLFEAQVQERAGQQKVGERSGEEQK